MMKRSIYSLLIAVIITLSMVGGVAAGPNGLGTPGEPNCVGQSMQFAAKDSHNFGKNGIGNLRKTAAALNHNTDVLGIMQRYCATGQG